MEATNQQNKENIDRQSQETLISWIKALSKSGLKTLPAMAKTLIIQIVIVLAFQLIFWWEGISRFIPNVIKIPIIFLTATYNDIIPKTLYWIILFTFGKKLFFRIKKSGFNEAMSPIMWLVPEFKKTMKTLSDKSYSLLFIGGGVGLIIANNFASYSRFSGARNKIDKYFIALLLSFTVSYLLGEGRKHWMFKFGRLAVSDFSRTFKTKVNYTDDHTFILLSGFVIGLLLDAPIILLKIGYGGYMLGILSIIGGIAIKLFYKRG